jgi:hypothetical protein
MPPLRVYGDGNANAGTDLNKAGYLRYGSAIIFGENIALP